MISPVDSWHRFTDPEDLLAFSKQLKLTPKTFTEPKPLIYKGIYTDHPTPCKLVGYTGNSFVVIETSDGLHTIHAEYLREMQTGSAKNQSNVESYTCIDIETTGIEQNPCIIELGALRVENGEVVDSFSQLVHSPVPISAGASATNGISDADLIGQPAISEVLPKFLDFIGDSLLVGHNISSFDIKHLNKACMANNLPEITNAYCDTMTLAKQKLGLKQSPSLQQVAKELNVQGGKAHRALGDCQTTQAIYEKLRLMEDSPAAAPKPASKARKTSQDPDHKLTAQEVAKYKSRPKAKDIHPTTDLFDPLHPLYDLTCVITGDLEQISLRDAMQGIADCGGHNADKVTKKTDLLIIGDGSDPTHKSQNTTRAEKYIAEGQQIRIVNETEFLELLHAAASLPDVPAQPQTGTDAARIYEEMCNALAGTQENYDLSKIQLVQRMPDKAAAYEAIELFGQSCLNFKGTKTLYLEVSPKIEALLTAAGIPLETDRANGWARVPAFDVSFANRAPLVVEIYEKYLMTNGFDCCSRYLACSEAGHCTHPDIMFAGQCTYRQKLRTGRIFYGEKRNV